MTNSIIPFQPPPTGIKLIYKAFGIHWLTVKRDGGGGGGERQRRCRVSGSQYLCVRPLVGRRYWLICCQHCVRQGRRMIGRQEERADELPGMDIKNNLPWNRWWWTRNEEAATIADWQSDGFADAHSIALINWVIRWNGTFIISGNTVVG